MMSRTHGQPATPTTLGKEMAKAAGSGALEFDPSTTDLIRRAFGG